MNGGEGQDRCSCEVYGVYVCIEDIGYRTGFEFSVQTLNHQPAAIVEEQGFPSEFLSR